MTDLALQQEKYHLSPDKLAEGFLASAKEISEEELLTLKEKAQLLVVLPFYESFRKKTFMIIFIIAAVAVLGYGVVSLSSDEDTAPKDTSGEVTSDPTEEPGTDPSATETPELPQGGGSFRFGGGETFTHTILPGENLYRIGLRYGVDYHLIAQANNILDENLIFAGQVLQIPIVEQQTEQAAVVVFQATATPEAPQSGYPAPPERMNVSMLGTVVNSYYYCVDEGESLSQIAEKFNTSVEWLVAVNGVENPAYIQMGQFLIVYPLN